MVRGRNREIDICKGILTVTMILCHCIQFFGFEEQGVQKILVNVINLTTFSGFLFCFGFVSNLAYYENRNFKTSAVKLEKNAVRLLVAFYVSGIAYMAFVEDKIFRWDFITEILLLKRYPGWSEFLASFAAMMLAGILLYPVLKRVNGWVVAAVAVISGAACFLPYASIHNSWLALFAGSRDFTTFPILQYMVFFAAGAWISRKRIWWKPQILAVVLVISLPCIIQFIRDGYLPERFPPSIFYIAGGSLFVYLDYLIAGGLERLREKTRILEAVSGCLERCGRASLHYLLLSNLLIFALDGSSFSFRSGAYAFGAFAVILLLISYLHQLRNEGKKNNERPETDPAISTGAGGSASGK